MTRSGRWGLSLGDVFCCCPFPLSPKTCCVADRQQCQAGARLTFSGRGGTLGTRCRATSPPLARLAWRAYHRERTNVRFGHAELVPWGVVIAVSERPDGSLVFHVASEQVGQTLVGALRRWLPDRSWSQIRKLVQSRRVQINGNLCLDEGRRLTEREVVKILAHSQALPPREDDVRIRHVDAHVVVVEKPSGVTTLRHSEEKHWPTRRRQLQPTLDELLPRILARRLSQPRGGRGDGADARGRKSQRAGRPGRPERGGRDNRQEPVRLPPLRPVHRLDRETSGLMVFARTVDAERHLVQQFRKHSIHRAYLAIVQGDIAEPVTIETHLVRDRGDGRRGSTTLADVGQRAVTHVRPLERFGAYTLIECRLETGRTHQIRIHLSERGHFVCGDKVYCQPLFQKPLVDRSGAPRLALHAAELGFVHPHTGEEVHFQQAFPPDLAQFLERLRRDRKATDASRGE